MGKTERPHANSLCGAKTRAGTPCKNRAMPNGRCRMHGGKSTGVKKNKNAEKHGLFSKYLPQETMDLVNGIEGLNTIDILWDNIKMQYAAIIRSQQVMHVKNKEEMIKELKKRRYEVKNVDGEQTPILTEEEYEFQFAWDRQATFLQSQSRAMTALTRMIKEYEELCKSDLATEQQKLRIEKLKKEVGDTEHKPIEIRLVTSDKNGN